MSRPGVANLRLFEGLFVGFDKCTRVFSTTQVQRFLIPFEYVFNFQIFKLGSDYQGACLKMVYACIYNLMFKEF